MEDNHPPEVSLLPVRSLLTRGLSWLKVPFEHDAEPLHPLHDALCLSGLAQSTLDDLNGVRCPRFHHVVTRKLPLQTLVKPAFAYQSQLCAFPDRVMPATDVLTKNVLDGSHAKRVTIMPKDIQLARRIRGERA